MPAAASRESPGGATRRRTARAGAGRRPLALLLGAALLIALAPGSCIAMTWALPADLPTDLPTLQPSDLQATTAPDRRGLRRDTVYFLGYQFVTIAFLYTLPESVTSWTEEQKSDYDLAKWWSHVTDPQWDSDEFYINYLLHPYWGGAYYVRARERHYSREQAFWYAVLLSSSYEFGAEALFEEPSVQDLFVTPIAGAFVGDYFERVRDRVRLREAARGYRTTREKWVMVLTDPLGALNRRMDRLVGRDAELQFVPFARHRELPATGERELVVGLTFSLRW